MTFFRTDIHLAQNNQDTLPMTYLQAQQQQQQSSSSTTTTTSTTTNPPAVVTKLFQHLFKDSTNKTDTRITSDPMNRLVSFHL